MQYNSDNSWAKLLLSCCLGILLFLTSFSLTAPVAAHALQTNYAFDLMKADLSFTASFSTGEPLVHGTVQIFAPDNAETPWKTLETDSQGHFSFLPDLNKPGNWTVQIGTEGHRDQWTIPVIGQGIQFEEISEGLHYQIHNFMNGRIRAKRWS
jgi:nickel transport protein